MLNRESEIKAVKELGERIGYGNMMDIASALWAISLEDKYQIPLESTGAFVPTVLPLIKYRDRKRVRNRLKLMVDGIRNIKTDGE